MSTSIKLHNKTIDKTSSILSPDNQTTDLEFKLPDKSGKLIVDSDIGSIQDSFSKDKLDATLRDVPKENEGKTVNGVYYNRTSATGKNSFFKPLERPMFFSVGDGPALKGVDAHFTTLREAFQEASYWRPILLDKIEFQYEFTNTTKNNINYPGNIANLDNTGVYQYPGPKDDPIKPGETRRKSYYEMAGGIGLGLPYGDYSSSLNGSYKDWVKDINSMRNRTTIPIIWIILKADYTDKDCHIFGTGENYSYITVTSENGVCHLDTYEIDRKNVMWNGDAARWLDVRNSTYAPVFLGIEFRPTSKFVRTGTGTDGTYIVPKVNGKQINVVENFALVTGRSYLLVNRCTIQSHTVCVVLWNQSHFIAVNTTIKNTYHGLENNSSFAEYNYCTFTDSCVDIVNRGYCRVWNSTFNCAGVTGIAHGKSGWIGPFRLDGCSETYVGNTTFNNFNNHYGPYAIISGVGYTYNNYGTIGCTLVNSDWVKGDASGFLYAAGAYKANINGVTNLANGFDVNVGCVIVAGTKK